MRRLEHRPLSSASALVLAAASGGLLYLSDHPVHVPALQVVAFVPFFVGLERCCRSAWGGALAGFTLGLAYTVPLALVLEFPLLMGGGLVAALSAMWALVGAGAFAARRSPLAVAAVFVLVEWAQTTLVPVWGTAQSFVRVWSAWPPAIQLTALTGMTGVVFGLVATQALAVALALRPERRRRTAATLAAVVAVAAAANALLWAREPRGAVRVAAMGWTEHDATPRLFDDLYAPFVAEAAAAGARLVVSPEVTFQPRRGELPALRGRLEALAARHGVTLAVGVFDPDRNDNRLLYVRPDGAAAEYVKTHLVPFYETYTPGDGTLVAVDLAGVRLGGMICQDDNFTDLARGYGRAGAQLVAVPTNDWREVAPYHLENARFRPVENGYAVVRAASNGTSAIVTARGELLASADHFALGPRLLVADVPLYAPGTPYARWGDWFPIGCGVLLAGAAVASRRRRAPR